MRYSRVVALALACPILWLSAPVLGAGQSVADFSGTDSYIDLGAPDALQVPSSTAFTVEGWMFLRTLSTRDMLYCKSNGRTTGASQYTYMVGFADGNLQALDGVSWLGNFDVSRETNRWYHLAFSYDGTNMHFYCDGILQGSVPFSFVNSSAHTVKIGGYVSYADIDGMMSDIRVWDHARGAADIQGYRLKRLAGDESGLLGYWPLNAGTGSRAYDQTANTSDGTLEGADWTTDTGLTLAPSDAGYAPWIPFAVADIETGSDVFTQSNAVDLTTFPIPQGYNRYQFTGANGDVAAIDGGGWQNTNAIQDQVDFDLPAGRTNVTLYAWYTNDTASVALLRSRDSIIYTTNKPIKVADFSGSDSYVLVGTPDALQIPSDSPFTVEGWMSLRSLTTRDLLFCKNNARSSPHTFHLGFVDGTLAAYQMSTTSWEGNFAVTRETNCWYHLAFSYDSTNMHFYFDGELQGSTAFSFANNTAHTVKFGGYASSADIDGMTSDIRVWNYARSEAEIQGDQCKRLAGDENGLLGYWPQDEGPGASVVYDRTVNGSHGTLVSADGVWDDSGLVLAPPDAGFMAWAALTVADIETGSEDFTNSNEVDLVSLPIPEGYDRYQVTGTNGAVAAIDGGGWQTTNAIQAQVAFDRPDGNTNVMLYAWFTNATRTVTLHRSMGTIIYTTNKPTAAVHANLSRTIVPGETVTVITAARLDTGSTGGTYEGQSIPLMAPTVYCSNDTTPAEPGYVTLDTVGNHLVALTVTNDAGNTDTACCTVNVAARTEPDIYVALDGNDSTGDSWATAYTSVYDAIAQSVGGDTIYIKGGDYPQDPTIAINGYSSLTIKGGYAGVGSPGVTGATATVITRASSLGSTTYRRFVQATFSTMTWERVTFKGARHSVRGAGLYLEQCDTTFIECSIRDQLLYDYDSAEGAGLYVLGGRLSMHDSTVHNNKKYGTYYAGDKRGMGMYAKNAEVFVSNTVFSLNHCDERGGSGYGGGLYLENGTATVISCSFIENELISTYGNSSCVQLGMGLYSLNVDPLTLRDCSFSDHYVKFSKPTDRATINIEGGNAFVENIMVSNSLNCSGVLLYAATCTLSDSLVASNQRYGLAVSGGNVQIIGTEILNNLLSPAIDVGSAHADTMLELTNVLIIGNAGHGVHGKQGTISLRNVTLADNTGWGVTNSAATVSVISSIVWDNTLGSLTNVGSVTYSCIDGGHDGEGNIDDDPLFADAASGNYYLKSFAGRWNPALDDWVIDPLPSSPCIRTGDPTDTRWQWEPEPNGRRVNMGAYGGTPFASKVVLNGTIFMFR